MRTHFAAVSTGLVSPCFFLGYLFQISGAFISCFKVFSASYNRKQSKSSAFFSSGPPISPHQNANLVTFFFSKIIFFLSIYNLICIFGK